MTLKDLLKKKDKINKPDAQQRSSSDAPNAAPEFTFMRTTTTTQEVITPPAFPGETPTSATTSNGFLSPNAPTPPKPENRKSIFGRSLSSAGTSSRPGSSDKRLSERIHFGSGRSRSASSLVNLPSDLPAVDEGVARSAEHEAQWEKRATILAKGTTLISRSGNHGDSSGLELPPPSRGGGVRSPSPGVSDPGKDVGGFPLRSLMV